MIVLNLIILFLFIILWFISKNYEADEVKKLDKKNHPLKAFYPLGFFLMDKLKLNKRKSYNNLEENLRSLYIGELVNNVKRLYFCGKIAITVIIIFLSNFLSLLGNLQSEDSKELIDSKYLIRPGYTEGSKTVDLRVNVSEQGVTILEEDMEIEVAEKEYDNDEIKRQFQYAKDYIDQHILKNNTSPDEVSSDLRFITRIPGSKVSISWISDNSKIIDSDGKIHNENLTEGILVPVTATILYNQDSEEYTRYFKVLPKEYTKEELVRQDLMEAINTANEESKTLDRLTLPDALSKQKISWAEKQNSSGGMFLISGVILAFILYKLKDRDLCDKVNKRNREMLLDYPEIINKFTLLVGAGMSLSNAWGKITRDYKEKGGQKRYAYEEMAITYGELMLGTSEMIAYERFGRRAKLLPYLRFSSLIAQNLKKGSSDLLKLLELEAAEAFEERKELAKRMGEEAGTKLLFPMMLMLMLVLIVILVPAFISLNF